MVRLSVTKQRTGRMFGWVVSCSIAVAALPSLEGCGRSACPQTWPEASVSLSATSFETEWVRAGDDGRIVATNPGWAPKRPGVISDEEWARAVARRLPDLQIELVAAEELRVVSPREPASSEIAEFFADAQLVVRGDGGVTWGGQLVGHVDGAGLRDPCGRGLVVLDGRELRVFDRAIPPAYAGRCIDCEPQRICPPRGRLVRTHHLDREPKDPVTTVLVVYAAERAFHRLVHPYMDEQLRSFGYAEKCPR